MLREKFGVCHTLWIFLDYFIRVHSVYIGITDDARTSHVV
jgi:hypothetical protein